MSRVAKSPVVIPEGIEVVVNEPWIKLKNNKGEFNYRLHETVTVAHNDKQLEFAPKNDEQNAMAQAGTARANVNNIVIGLTDGFCKKLILIGVGYRAQMKGKSLELTLGFSHDVNYPIPEGIQIETPSQTEIVIKGADKQKVGQVAAEIRAYRPVECYKGKGIRYENEDVKIKETKK